MTVAREVVLVANARMPSQRAQSIQVAHAAHAFCLAGYRATLVHARRRDTPEQPAAGVWEALGVVPDGEAPGLVAAPCSDWIDRVPRRLQFVPARLQEWTFGRSAARIVRERFPGALCLVRDIEVARGLAGRPGMALEIHRVPGGTTRRRWLLAAVSAGAPVIAISGGVRDDLLALGVPPDRVTVEHDAVDPTLVERLPSRSAGRAALGLDADRQVVLYAGGLLAWKGVEVAVEAAREGGFGDALLVIVGGMDADVARLRSFARGAAGVRIDGFRPAAEILAYLAAADVGIVPNRSRPRISSHYTSPLKVFEAMAAGLPLVVSDLPSLRDVLHGDEATFVAPDDPSALAAGVSALLADAPRRAAASAAMRARAQDLTWEARARRILALLEASHAPTVFGR